MAQYFKIHPEHPQQRLIIKAVDIIRRGGIVVFPTDSGYALGCHIGDKAALFRIIRIRQLHEKHHFTLFCRNLSETGVYANFDTPVFRLLKANTPGPYTFILNATREVPKRLMHIKQKTIGIRIPDYPVVMALLEELNEPFFTTTLIMPEEIYPMTDAEEIRDRLQRQVDLVVDSGQGGTMPTTMIDLTHDDPVILREGKGDVGPFL